MVEDCLEWTKSDGNALWKEQRKMTKANVSVKKDLNRNVSYILDQKSSNKVTDVSVSMYNNLLSELLYTEKETNINYNYRTPLIPSIDQRFFNEFVISYNSFVNKLQYAKNKKKSERVDDFNRKEAITKSNIFKSSGFLLNNIEKSEEMVKYREAFFVLVELFKKVKKQHKKERVVTKADLSKAVKHRAEQNLCLLPTDKSKRVIFVEEDKVKKMLEGEHIRNEEMYKKAEKSQIGKREAAFKKLEEKVKKCAKATMSYSDYKQLGNSKIGQPRLRLYVKDHKAKNMDTDSYPTRPVVYAGDGAEFKIAALVENALKAMLRDLGNCYISLEGNITRLQALYQKNKCQKLIKADIKSMFPNIPQQLCLKKIANFIEQNWKYEYCFRTHMSKEILLECCEFLLIRPLIAIGEDVYQQVKGVLIGSPAALPMAEVYLWACEEKGVSQNTLSRERFMRYIDDYVCLDDEEGNTFKELSKLVRPLELLKEMEGSQVQFLNTIVYLDKGRLCTKHYFKDNAVLNDYRSIIEKKVKVNTLKEYVRIIRVVSDNNEDIEESLNKFRSLAKTANYPNYIVEKVIYEAGKEDGTKEAYLWDINWRVYKAEIEQLTKKRVKYINRSYVMSDGWCLLYAIMGEREEQFYIDCITPVAEGIRRWTLERKDPGSSLVLDAT